MDYFGVSLSENIAKTPEGYVICKDVVIGRTGYQDYRVSQLSKAQLRDLGLLERFSDPDEVVQVYRSAEQVFAPATIASFEGKPVTDLHPKKFVDAENHADLQRGHIQNIRRGDQPLSNGDIPMLADMIITDPDLGDDVLQRRKRELSCGYDYKLSWDGTKLSQEDIYGNHTAVVPKGRAGAEARINDAADIPTPIRKQNMNIKEWFFGPGITAMAKDSVDPKQIAAAARAFANDEEVEEKPEPKKEEPKAEDADPLAEIRDSLKSLCDRMDAYDKANEAKDEEKPEEAKDEESEEQEAESEDADEDEEEEGKGEDAFIEPAVSESDLIKSLRPHIARSKDAALKAEFNKLIAQANDSQRGGSPKGAYGKVQAAAGKKSAAALDAADAREANIARLNERAQAAFSGQKAGK
ncbi:MAG TPA: DUF2213 domain-containing protein [Acidobacteriaceae bacterium]|jgi:hypothetical protein